MDSLIKKYFRGDSTLWIVFIALCLVSVVEMYSASSTLAYQAANYSAPVMRHVGFLGLGALLAIAVHLVPYRYIRLLSYLGLALSVVLLILVIFKGKSENEASRWLVIGGVQFQPSEIAKLSVIIVAADFISRIKNKVDEKKYFWRTITMLGIICTLIVLDNLSTAIILFLVVYIMMFIGRISVVRLGLLAISLMIGLVIGYGALKMIPKDSDLGIFKRGTTWVARIDRHLHSDDNEKYNSVITDDNRQVQYGKIAVAKGGFFGVFPGNSEVRDYLPQAYSDFIYAIIIEEMGLLGGIGVMLLYVILLFRAGRIATKSPTVFPAVLVIGLSLMIVIQALINMAVATNLIPVTGQPLPLISRGGTAILITCIYFGIILGITRQLKEQNQPSEDGMDAKEVDNSPVVAIDDLV